MTPLETEIAEHKPGYKTTEFWLSMAVTFLSALYASGLIGQGSTAAKVIALAITMLTSLGYTRSRARIKTGAKPRRRKHHPDPPKET